MLGVIYSFSLYQIIKNIGKSPWILGLDVHLIDTNQTFYW